MKKLAHHQEIYNTFMGFRIEALLLATRFETFGSLCGQHFDERLSYFQAKIHIFFKYIDEMNRITKHQPAKNYKTAGLFGVSVNSVNDCSLYRNLNSRTTYKRNILK